MAGNIFLKLDGIKGTSTSAQGKDEIEILSFSHGVSMPLAAAGSASGGVSMKPGKCNHQDFTIKYLDITSPTLLVDCSTGNNIKDAHVSLWMNDGKGDPLCYYTIVMKDVVITSISVGGGGGDIPVESVTFHYNEIEWTYHSVKTDAPGGEAGKQATKFNLETNKKG